LVLVNVNAFDEWYTIYLPWCIYLTVSPRLIKFYWSISCCIPHQKMVWKTFRLLVTMYWQEYYMH